MAKPQVKGYDLIRLIGCGANSEIYQAIEHNSGRRVAVKVVRIKKADERKYLNQVKNEYKIGSELDHPNIVKMYRLDTVHKFIKVVGANLIMELIDGIDLERDRNYSMGELVRFYMQTALGLQYMHDQGFIHTDIKPNNIVIHKKRIAKVVDLGIARRCGTPSGRVQGTMPFIAPEQMLRKYLDERTDIYNLGATFYYVFRGEFLPRPVVKDGLGTSKLLNRHRTVDIRSINPDVPEAVEAVIRRSCELDADDRPSSIQEVIDVLEPYIEFGTGRTMAAQE